MRCGARARTAGANLRVMRCPFPRARARAWNGLLRLPRALAASVGRLFGFRSRHGGLIAKQSAVSEQCEREKEFPLDFLATPFWGNAKKVFVLSTYCAVEIGMSPFVGATCLQPLWRFPSSKNGEQR